MTADEGDKATLWSILEDWESFHLVAVLRCDHCRRRLGEVRRRTIGRPSLGVVRAGSAGRAGWEVADDDDEADPALLLSVKPWGRVMWLDDPVPGRRTFDEIANALDLVDVGATQCSKCRRRCGWYLEWASPSHTASAL